MAIEENKPEIPGDQTSETFAAKKTPGEKSYRLDAHFTINGQGGSGKTMIIRIIEAVLNRLNLKTRGILYNFDDPGQADGSRQEEVVWEIINEFPETLPPDALFRKLDEIFTSK